MTDAIESGTGPLPRAEDEAAFASVVRVERHEDIATICGRLDTAPSYAVVLHASRGNRALSREIGMRRLLRHADETGKVIAFATTNGALSSRARALSIPVARKPEHVRWDSGGKVVWRLPGHSLAVPALGRLIQVAFLLGIAAVFAGLLLTMAPFATVIVYPPTETLERTVVVTASAAITEPDIEALRVPATEVTSTRLVTVAVPTTGSTMVGTEPAQVTLTITNTTAQPVTIPAGTEAISQDGSIAFALPEDATLVPGETTAVLGVAVEPGEAGNIPPETLVRFRDAEFALIRVSNAGNAGGGVSEPRPAVDLADIQRMRDTAASLESAASIRATIVADRPGDAIFLDSAQAAVETGDPSGFVGEVADVVTMEIQVTVTALAVTAEVLDRIALAALQPELGSGEFIPGTVRAVETGARKVARDDGVYTTEFLVRGEFARGMDSAAIEDAVKGRSAEGARSALAGDYGIEDAEVDVSPGWAPRLPRFGFRINVELRARDTTTATSDSATGQTTATSPGQSPLATTASSRP